MILDAGCGNRCMWLLKENENVLHIDIEKALQIKPDLFASNTSLPFKTEAFDTVFFDPPFAWNTPAHPFFSYPNYELMHQKYPNRDRNGIQSYYGIERYKTRGELAAYLYRAEREIRRVLKPDGCLWLRWCTMNEMDHNNVLGIFTDWHEMLRHEIGSAKRNTGETSSYWFMLMKKPIKYVQPDLFTAVPMEALVK